MLFEYKHIYEKKKKMHLDLNIMSFPANAESFT